MLNKKEQQEILSLVQSTKPLIFAELKDEHVTVKGAADYVTNVDFAVQEYMKAELKKRFSEIPLIAEEKENKNLKREGTYWILDPIDGTTNLIYGYQMSAVALALYEKGEITFGAVYNPFHEELFYGAKGEGAFLNGKKIQVSPLKDLKDAVISFGSSPYEKERAKDLFPLFYKIFMHCADFRRTGSAELDLCYVACGRHHGFLEQYLKPWDYAAGSLILSEAGGLASTWDGSPLPFLENADVLAVTRDLKESLQALVKEEKPDGVR